MEKTMLTVMLLLCLFPIALGVVVWFSIAPFIARLILSAFAILSGVLMAVLAIYILKE